MKKSIIFWAIALCSVCLAVSCERDILVIEENTPEETKMITVSCTIADINPDTKVSLTNDGTVGKTSWVEGDEVFFHGEYVGTKDDKVYSCVARAYNVSADGKSASFDIPDLASPYSSTSYKSTLFAAYPASAVTEFTGRQHWYYLTSFKNTNQYLLGGYNNPEIDEGHSFTFVNLTGALSFKVTGEFDAYKVVGNNHEVLAYGNYCVSLAETSTWGPELRTCYRGSTAPGPTSDPKEYVYVKPTDPNWANGMTINTVYFPGTGNDKVSPKIPWTEAANFTSGFTILFYKNDVEVKRVSTSSPKNIAIGKYLDLGDISDHLYTYVPPVAHNNTIGVNVNTAIDLSASSTANCYIVEKNLYSLESVAGQSFKFMAAKGKGGAVITNINTEDEANDVVVLWETQNTATAPTAIISAVDYDLQEGGNPYIVFKMPDSENLTYGNSIIAAKNSSGEILWTWHIWVPETAIGSDTYSISTPNMMDRNLGALVVAGNGDIRANGLFYQWGRKDPFVGQGQHGSSTLAAVSGAVKSVNDVEMTIAETIKNPTKFSPAVTPDSDNKKYWWPALADRSTTLWGESKTTYDPCPPGWHVPTYSHSDIFTSSSLTVTFDSANYCATVGSAVFPLAGRLHYSDGSMSDKDVKLMLWSAHGNDSGLSRWFNVYQETKDAVTTTKYNHWDERSAIGASVRCVAE